MEPHSFSGRWGPALYQALVGYAFHITSIFSNPLALHQEKPITCVLLDTLCLQYNASLAVAAVVGLVAGMLKGVITIFLIFLQSTQPQAGPRGQKSGWETTTVQCAGFITQADTFIKPVRWAVVVSSPTLLAAGTSLWRLLSQHSLDGVWASFIFFSAYS